MKMKLLSIIATGLLALASFTAKADTYIANANIYWGTASGCYWTLTYSSGGGGAPQFYDLYCSGAKVVTQQKVGGSCYFYSLAAGYRLEGTGCSTSVYRIDVPQPTNVLVGEFGTPPVAYNSCSWRLTSSSGGGGAPQFYTLGCPGAYSVISMMTVGLGSSASCYITTAAIAGYRTEGTNCAVKVYKN